MPTAAEQQRQRTSYLSSSVRWLKLKKYQYEVTFSLYMLTETEKFIFNVIILVLFSLLVTAASMYLPDHIAQIYTRIWYYVHGELAQRSRNGSVNGVVEGTRTAVRAAAETAEAVGRRLKEL